MPLMDFHCLLLLYMDGNSRRKVGETGSRKVDELLGGGDDNNSWIDWVAPWVLYGCCE